MSPVLTISQSHLRVWETCPKQFQYSYLDRLSVPQPIDFLSNDPSNDLNALELGSQFHLLLQQQSLGLDVQPIIKDKPKLQSWFNAFQDYAASLPKGDYLTEHRRTLAMGLDFQLTVIFDLLVLQPGRAQIFDWKTHQKPPSAKRLSQDWQTRLYLYVLTKTSDYLPEQLSIAYWFANVGQQISIKYDLTQHLQTERDLRQHLEDISESMSKSSDMPKLSEGSASCDRCQFRYICWQPVQKLAAIDYPEIEI
jgi:CRISPR/Cas system-associated exonuclease Cas4 (RecB family)